MMSVLCPSLLLLLASFLSLSASGAEYGVDVSFPMHHPKTSSNYDWLEWNTDPQNHETPAEYKDMVVQPLGDRQTLYEEMIQGCVDYYGDKGFRCREYEHDRVEMTLRQPQSMENYTDTGFKKIKAPPELWKMIKEFWDRNKESQREEKWPSGNTYTNHWFSPTRILSVEETSLRGGGKKLKKALWAAAKDTISDWTNAELTECSLYGVRVYTRGSVLSSHVDRLPLVSSAIINVANDLEEPWPLEVVGHDGRAVNVTMEAGDMVLYESHTVIHGRPFPLKGEYVANLFVHFEPLGHSTRHNRRHSSNDPDKKYAEDISAGIGGHETDNHHVVEEDEEEDNGLPPYLLPNSPEVPNWLSRHPDSAAARRAQQDTSTTGSTPAHIAAAGGDVERLTELVEEDEALVTAKDANGWTPLHEATRSGNVEAVKYLMSKGALDINHRTKDGDGYSPLAIAHQVHGPEHPMFKFIESIGGELIEPEL